MANSRPWSRRTALKGTLALGALSPLGISPRLLLAADAPLTPACRDEHQAQATLPSVTGPYFRPNSPERGDLIDAKSDGHLITLEGRVLSRSCQTIAHVLLDLWHADQDARYDEHAFRYRSHIHTHTREPYSFP